MPNSLQTSSILACASACCCYTISGTLSRAVRLFYHRRQEVSLAEIDHIFRYGWNHDIDGWWGWLCAIERRNFLR